MTTPSGPTQQAAMEAAQRARYEAIRTSVSQNEAANIAALARDNPTLSPGLLYSAGRAGIQPGTPVAQELGKQDQQNKGWSLGRVVTGAYRSAKTLGGAVLPDIVGESVDAVAPAIKGVSRGAFGLAAAPGEALQQTFRESVSDGLDFGDVGNLFNPASGVLSNLGDTSFGQLIKQIRDDKEKDGALEGVDTGRGFFLGGQVAEDQRRIARESAPLINGKAVTLGRYFADTVTEPGTKPYNVLSGLVDASIALSTDPTTYAAAPTKALQARRLLSGDASKKFLEDAGAIEGIRKTVNNDRALEWLTTSAEGQNVVKYLAGETNIANLMKNTGNRLDPKLMVELLATKPEETTKVIELLGPQLGRTAKLDKKFSIDAQGLADQGLSGGAGMGGKLGTWATASVQRRADRARILGMKPGERLDKNDLSSSLKTFDDAMRNAKFSADERAPYLLRLASVDDTAQMLEITTDFAADVAKRAMQPSRNALGRVSGGMTPEDARKITTLYKDRVKADRLFWQDQIGRNKAFGQDKDVVRLANGEIAPQPHLAAQMLDSNVPLPDAREIRQAISPYRNLLANPLVKTPLAVTEKLTDNIFKPFALLRPAYAVRNALDEQFRPAGVGLNTMFNHPIQYINWLMSDQAAVAKILQKPTGGRVGQGRGQQDILGTAFDEERAQLRAAEQALKQAEEAGDVETLAEAKRQLDYATKALGSRGPLQDGASAYVRSLEGGVGNWRNRTVGEKEGYALIQRDEPQYAQVLAEALHQIHLDPVAVRVARGGVIPGDVKQGTRTGLDGIKDWHWRGGGQGYRQDLAKVNERMKWLEDEVGSGQYIDDTESFVTDAVGESALLREAAATGKINGIELTIGDDLKVNPAAIEEINRLKALGEGPDAIGGKKPDQMSQGIVSGYDRAVEWAYRQLGSRPSDYLARSPIFRQQYYRRMETLIIHASPEAQQEIIDGAIKAKMKPVYVKRLQARKERHTNGTLTTFEADEVAKADALDYTKNLVYDLSTRSQFFDVTRVLFPFGEAFANTAKTYSRIAVNNPVVPYRLGQVVGGGRDLDLDGDGKGFFYTDEQTGQEMFNWPMSGLFAEQLGVEGFKSPLAGLNLMGSQIIPGFGPVVQIAASEMLPNEPEFNGVRKLVAPYGDKTLDGGIIESFLPAWINKFRTAEIIPFLDGSPDQQRAFAEAMKDVQAYLVSTGEYNVATPQAQQDLIAASKKRATVVFVLRGMAQAFTPSPPSPSFVAEDQDGVLHTQFKLAERLNELQQEDFETAMPRFIDEFGINAIMAAMSNTRSADDVSPLPATEDALKFFQDNRDAADRHRDVFGLFAPSGGKFSFAAYDQQLKTGQRIPLTANELNEKVNDRVATMLYNQAKDKAGDKVSKDERATLAAYKDELKQRYPGYAPGDFANPDVLIDKLTLAAGDPTLARTDRGKALVLYLQARDAAEQFSQKKYGVGFKRGKDAAPVREKLREYATALDGTYPGFAEMFERSFDRELADD